MLVRWLWHCAAYLPVSVIVDLAADVFTAGLSFIWVSTWNDLLPYPLPDTVGVIPTLVVRLVPDVP